MSKSIFVLIQKIITTLALAERQIRGDLMAHRSGVNFEICCGAQSKFSNAFVLTENEFPI